MIHVRTPIEPNLALELPPSIVWLNRGTWALCGLLGAMAVTLAIRAFLLAPWFSIQTLSLTGDTQFHNELTIKANVLPALTGNYFSVNLRTAQQQFTALPWIRSAVVQREFPNQLRVQLTAHVPAAKWSSDTEANDTGSERFINQQGEVFEATEGGPLDTQSLPELSGPLQSSAQVLQAYQELQKVLTPQIAPIEKLTLSSHGSWRAVLANQATVELGSGTPGDIVLRTTKWLEAMPSVFQRYGARQLRSVDLRYSLGFAVQMAGVTTR